jgi:shikimate kinase
MKNIYLMGFMGTGKTTVGKMLAERLNRPFIDMDEEIEKRENKTISDIFDENGEQYFRELETVLLLELSQKGGMVIATGGGSIVTRGNLEIVRQNGILFALMASPEEILKRTTGNNDRPLLNVSDEFDTIKQLLFERAPFYAKADYIIETTETTPEEVVKEIEGIINDIKD